MTMPTTTTTPFHLPPFNFQIKRAAHSSPPKRLPSPTATYNSVRHFIYTILTLSSYGICTEHPWLIRSTVNAWVGDGAVFAKKVEEWSRKGYTAGGLQDVIPMKMNCFEAVKGAREVFVREVMRVYESRGFAKEDFKQDEAVGSGGESGIKLPASDHVQDHAETVMPPSYEAHGFDALEKKR